MARPRASTKSKKLGGLLDDLAPIRTEWDSIKVAFTGSFPSSPLEWDDWYEIGQAGNLANAFGSAWHEALIRARNLFLSDFASWAARLIEVVGFDRFQSAADMPPQRRIPRNACDDPTVQMADANDTHLAAIRIVFWAAAANNPSEY